MSERELITPLDLSSLKPYHGYQSSIIPLSSNYYYYLASWDRTPTQFPRFSNVWLVTPENKRILFSDPPGSSEIVCLYHVFDEIYGASIRLDWISDTQFNVQCESIDEVYKLNAKFYINEPLTSRLLLALGSGPPTQFRISRAMVAITNFLVNSLVAKGGSVLLGKTETGQPFYHGDAERLFQVLSGSVSLNGEDLGTFTNPTWSIEFGDAVPYFIPVVKLGTLYIPFEQDMLRDRS
jgi:hypothetical protein